MKRIIYLSILCLILFFSCGRKPNGLISQNNVPEGQMIPIISIGTGINVWSKTQLLYGNNVVGYNGRSLPFVGMIRVDGQVYQFMGDPQVPLKAIATISADSLWNGRYTFTQPKKKWENPNFDDSDWDIGQAPFGTPNHYAVNTIWPSSDIWVRREVNITRDQYKDLNIYLKYSHDDVLDLYVNGVPFVQTGLVWGENLLAIIPDSILSKDENRITISAHCINKTGGALLDFGIYCGEISSVAKDWEDKYTFEKPSNDWLQTEFNDSLWNKGKSPFGTAADYRVNTPWETSDIWIRRKMTIDKQNLNKALLLEYSFDNAMELFINGSQVIEKDYLMGFNKRLLLPEALKNTFQGDSILIAAHCSDYGGESYADFGIIEASLAAQKSVSITPTQTQYSFECGGVKLDLNFISPFVLSDIDMVSQPVNYISYNISSLDSKSHEVEIYFEASPAWASNGRVSTNQTEVYKKEGLAIVKTGLKDQKVFSAITQQGGIDWGYFYMCGEESATCVATGEAFDLRKRFADGGSLSDTTNRGISPYMAISQALGKVDHASGLITVGYDDIKAVQYFGDNLNPYWNPKGNIPFEQILSEADHNFDKYLKKCQSFDKDLIRGAIEEKGIDYAMTLNYTYRNIVASIKLASDRNDKKLLFFNPKNTDRSELYALLLRHNVQLLKSSLDPYFDYCHMGYWTKEYPPTDLGDFPNTNGQIAGYENPIYLTSYWLQLMCEITKSDGNADYAKQNWKILTKWYNYLLKQQLSYQQKSQIKLRNSEKTDEATQYTISAGINAYNEIKRKM